jgi:hypothetical protein
MQLLGIIAVAAFVVPTRPASVAVVPPVSTIFNLPPAEIERANLTGTVKRLGLAVKAQVGRTPRAGETFEKCRDDWEAGPGVAIDWLAANDLDLIADGDDLAREHYMRAALDGTEWASRFLGHIAARLRGYVRCHRIDVVDESNTKIPSWWKPARLVGPWRAAGGPPIAWPSLLDPSPLETAEDSDATARQDAWFNRHSLGQHIRGVWDCTRKLPPGRVLSCLVCAIEKVERVQPNGSTLPSGGGVKPGGIMALTWAALARGASILEFYAFDCQRWIDSRINPAPGAVLWTGIRPGSALWAEFEATQRTILEHSRELSGQPYRALWRPPHLFGRRGRLAWSVHLETGRVRFRKAG